MLLALVLAMVGCNGDGPNGPSAVDQAKIGAACGAFSACTREESIGDCVTRTYAYTRFDLADVSLMIGMNDDRDSVNYLSLGQNVDCVAAATSCDAVYACLNAGTATTGCTPPNDSFRGRSCEGNTLIACTETGVGEPMIEARADCRAHGLTCVEIGVAGEESIPACVNSRASDTLATGQMKVTCSGYIANVQVLNAVMTYDCRSFMGSTCVAGDYTGDFEAAQFCEPSTVVCDSNTFEEHCDGNSVVECRNGLESREDCASYGMICGEIAYDSGTYHGCRFVECSRSYKETCEDGSITYCDPDGVKTIDCKALGFTGCTVDNNEAACTE